VQVIWSGPTVVGGGLSTFYFNDSVGTAAQNVSSVGTFLTTVATQMTSSLTWATASDVATLNVGTGNLESLTSTTPSTGAGSAAGDPAPYVTQGLLRLFTNIIAGTRLLRGRLFLPGVVEASSTGVPSAGYITAWNGAAATLIADANSEWSVWSRTHATLANITTASTWNRWAILRSRRD
jgi:hypothetical protein